MAQVFSCEFCEISKNTFSYRTPPVVASDSSGLEIVFIDSSPAGPLANLRQSCNEKLIYCNLHEINWLKRQVILWCNSLILTFNIRENTVQGKLLAPTVITVLWLRLIFFAGLGVRYESFLMGILRGWTTPPPLICRVYKNKKIECKNTYG